MVRLTSPHVSLLLSVEGVVVVCGERSEGGFSGFKKALVFIEAKYICIIFIIHDLFFFCHFLFVEDIMFFPLLCPYTHESD